MLEVVLEFGYVDNGVRSSQTIETFTDVNKGFNRFKSIEVNPRDNEYLTLYKREDNIITILNTKGRKI